VARIAIIYCKKIKDHSCIACAKCFKGVREKNGEFARYETAEIVAMTDCGDCPGLTVPRLKLLKEMFRGLGGEFDVVHLGTCVKAAMETAACPIDLDELQATVSQRLGTNVVLGTHSY
jgi:predicted metal-binding protein